MSYHVQTLDSTASIDCENLERAFEIARAANAPDKLEHVSGYPHKDAPSDSKSVNPTMSSHISGMDWNYDVTCKSIADVLTMMGFDVEYDAAGNLDIVNFNANSGAEQEMLELLAPCIVPGTYIRWAGEDGCVFENIFDGQRMSTEYPMFSL